MQGAWSVPFLFGVVDDDYVITHTDTRRRADMSVQTRNFQVVCLMRHHARLMLVENCHFNSLAANSVEYVSAGSVTCFTVAKVVRSLK